MRNTLSCLLYLESVYLTLIEYTFDTETNSHNRPIQTFMNQVQNTVNCIQIILLLHRGEYRPFSSVMLPSSYHKYIYISCICICGDVAI